MKWVQGVTNPHVIQDENGLWVATCAKGAIAEQIVNFNNNFLEEANKPILPIPVKSGYVSGWGNKLQWPVWNGGGLLERPCLFSSLLLAYSLVGTYEGLEVSHPCCFHLGWNSCSSLLHWNGDAMTITQAIDWLIVIVAILICVAVLLIGLLPDRE